MRAVVDWSYGLLSEDEQLFFRALGIFTGGFTVEAAAAMAMDSFVLALRPSELSRRGPENVTKMTG
jgi:predicted ATPase